MTADTGRILHELPGRLRIRVRAEDDTRAMLHRLADLDGVERIRLNRAAGSLRLDFDPRRLSRDALLARLAPPAATRACPAPPAPDARPVVRSLLGLLITPQLPPPLRLAVRSTRAAIRVTRGLDALLHQGAGVDVLHAIAVCHLLSRGRLDLVGRLGLLVSLGRYLTARRLYLADGRDHHD